MPRKPRICRMVYMTVNPCPAKLHMGQRYDLYDHDRQRGIIHRTLLKALKWCEYDTEEIPVYYELTKKLNVHAHFKVTIDSRGLKDMQNYIAKALGNPRLSPDICCHFCPEACWKPKINPDTEKPYESWDEYCNKDYIHKGFISCQCLNCKITTGDTRTIKKIEHGELVLRKPSAEQEVNPKGVSSDKAKLSDEETNEP